MTEKIISIILMLVLAALDIVMVYIDSKYIKEIVNKRKESYAIKVLYHDEGLQKIEKIENGDWIDLRSAEDVEMKAGDFKLISLGVSIKQPDGYEAHVAPRSSTFKKWGVLQANSVGVIDNSYSGNDDIWMFPAIAMRDTCIHKNDRICQFRIVEKMPEDISIEQVENLGENNRGGFGSTGTN